MMWARTVPVVEEIDWGYWSEQLARAAAANPRFSIVLKSSRTRRSFGGIVPADWNRQTIEVFV